MTNILNDDQIEAILARLDTVITAAGDSQQAAAIKAAPVPQPLPNKTTLSALRPTTNLVVNQSVAPFARPLQPQTVKVQAAPAQTGQVRSPQSIPTQARRTPVAVAQDAAAPTKKSGFRPIFRQAAMGVAAGAFLAFGIVLGTAFRPDPAAPAMATTQAQIHQETAIKTPIPAAIPTAPAPTCEIQAPVETPKEKAAGKKAATRSNVHSEAPPAPANRNDKQEIALARPIAALQPVSANQASPDTDVPPVPVKQSSKTSEMGQTPTNQATD